MISQGNLSAVSYDIPTEKNLNLTLEEMEFLELKRKREEEFNEVKQ